MLIISILFTSLAAHASSSAFAVTDAESLSSEERRAYQVRFIMLLNQFRSKSRVCGEEKMPAVGKIRHDVTLSLAAQEHSEEMARRVGLDHQGQDGSRFSDRIRRVGYSGCARGENIAYHTSKVPDADRVFRQWRDSPGHCVVMMRSKIDEVGLGLAYGPAPLSGRLAIYYTMDTGKSDCSW